jgi:hypothetical protein
MVDFWADSIREVIFRLDEVNFRKTENPLKEIKSIKSFIFTRISYLK